MELNEAKNTNAQQAEELSEKAYNELVAVRREKLKGLQEAGNDPFQKTKYPQDAYAADIKREYEYLAAEEETGKMVYLAGRMMSKRVMGKASFADLRDNSGDIQLYVRRDAVGEDEYAAFKKFDIGDVIGVRGEIFRTKMGEISVRCTEIELLAKSLRPLPEKFHGLKDQEIRYRQRYVDLIVNPDVKETFVKRSMILREIRDYLDSKGFLEVDTPILLPLEIGASARPFVTHHNTLDIDMYLRIETELNLKRLIVGGFDRVYEVGRIFRNEGMDTKHNPEFTSIELYQAFTDYKGMMDLVEELYKRLAQKICGSLVIPYQGHMIDMGHWERLTMAEAVKKYAGCDYYAWATDEDARAAAKEKHVEVPADATKGTVLVELFDAYVEDKLIQPTFITMHPVDVSPLAKRSPSDPRLTERFELFICHSEMGNAFSELNDPIDQKQRFQKQVELREGGDEEAGMMDEDYITALEYGLPPTGGLGIGIDRCVMMLTNNDSIREVLLFPTMKPLDMPKGEKKAEVVAAPAAAQQAEEVIDFSKVEIEPLFSEFVDFETF
ncbi:MAG TPA: lysine--tRNA ligase, partial [Clostridiales bacterium]|nr:lysine--tRNA ligase [Clostridiales bacterium]